MRVSYIVLGVSGVMGVVGFVFLCLTFASNHWVEHAVQRQELIRLRASSPSLYESLRSFNAIEIYFDRSYGLFRVCFPNLVPTTYVNPGNTNLCFNNKQWEVPETTKAFRRLGNQTEAQKARIHYLRSCVASYSLGICFLVVAFVFFILYICTQWWTLKRRQNLILVSAIFATLGSMLLLLGMIFWLRAKYLDEQVIAVAPHPSTWHEVLQKYSEWNYGWSYVVFWLGLTLVILWWIGLWMAWGLLRHEERRQKKKARNNHDINLLAFQTSPNHPYYNNTATLQHSRSFTKGQRQPAALPLPYPQEKFRRDSYAYSVPYVYPSI